MEHMTPTVIFMYFHECRRDRNQTGISLAIQNKPLSYKDCNPMNSITINMFPHSISPENLFWHTLKHLLPANRYDKAGNKIMNSLYADIHQSI